MRLAQFPAFAAAALLSCVGCARTVALRHVLPAAAPITGRFSALRLKSLNVTPKEHTGLETVFKNEAVKHRHEWTFLGGPLHTMGLPPTPADVEVTVHVEAKDTKGLRHIRRWDPKTKQTAEVEVPTLVRSVQVRADFLAVPRGGGKNTAVELRREWKSTEDPRVRGELGLERPDDPQRVPDTRTVVAELFGQCVERFCAMVSPVVVSADVKRRLTFLRNKDSVPVRFNEVLALEVEATKTGRGLDKVLAGYEGLSKRTEGKDATIEECVLRVRRVLKAKAARQ